MRGLSELGGCDETCLPGMSLFPAASPTNEQPIRHTTAVRGSPGLSQATKASVQQPDIAKGTSSSPPQVRSQLQVSKPLNVRSPSFAPGLPSVPQAAPLVQGPWHDARATKAMRDDLKMEGGGQPPKIAAKRSELPEEVVLKIPEALMGVVIGKKGATIKRLIKEAAELRCSIRVLSRCALMVICGAGQDVEVMLSARSMSA